MLGKDGVDVAVRFLEWVGKNFPGATWKKKAAELVRCSGSDPC